MNYLVSGTYARDGCEITLPAILICVCIFINMVVHRVFIVLVEGFKEAAEKFEQEAGISSPLKLNTLGNRIKVIEAVQSGKMQEAITLINQLYPGLLDDDRDLYFHLQVHKC